MRLTLGMCSLLALVSCKQAENKPAPSNTPQPVENTPAPAVKREVAKPPLPAQMTPVLVAVFLVAFGRAGAIADQPAIIAAAAGQPANVVAAAELALGRRGRRKLAYQNATRDWLVERAADQASEVRYAAAYALSREHQPLASPAVAAALAKLAADPEPEPRAPANAGR